MLILRRTYNDHPRPEDDEKFWSVLHKGVLVGCINERQGPADTPPYWIWVIHMHAGRHSNDVKTVTPCDGRAATRDACMPAFRRAFERYLNFVGEEGWAAHVEHMRQVEARKQMRAPTISGTKLSAQEARRIIHCGGNFTLSRVDLPIEDGRTRAVTFQPPYHLEDGFDYALRIPPGDGEPELWEVEQIPGGEDWKWSRKAKRSDQIAEERAPRH